MTSSNKRAAAMCAGGQPLEEIMIGKSSFTTGQTNQFSNWIGWRASLPDAASDLIASISHQV
jgi:hypothetical protein